MIDVNNEKKAIVGAFSIDEFDSSTSSYSFLFPFGYNSTAKKNLMFAHISYFSHLYLIGNFLFVRISAFSYFYLYLYF